MIVLARDEEPNMGRVLSSVMWADQVIVVDSGSTDDTVAIAIANDAEVVATHWRGYGAQREFALRMSNVKNDWVLFVDSDEWVSSQLAAEIESVLARDDDCAAYWMYFRLVFMGRWIRHCGWYPSARIVRLVRRSRVRFRAGEAFSEHPVVDGRLGRLAHDLVDEDRKGLASWLHKHVNYAELESSRRAQSRREVSRRDNQSVLNFILKDVIAPNTPARPVVQFVYMYILRLGFLDGRPGLAFCFYHSWFQKVVQDLSRREVHMSAPAQARDSIAFLIGQFPPAYRGGGPVRSVLAMIRNAPRTVDCRVLCSHRDWGSTEPLPVPSNRWVERNDASVYYSTDHRPTAYVRGLWALRRSRPTLIYLNGVFDIKHSVVPSVLARLGVFGGAAVAICPRGELDPGALGNSRKKHVLMRILRTAGVYSKVVGHATNSSETELIQLHLGCARVVTRPPETDLPGQPLTVRPRYPHRFVFYSRIDRKKGLDILIRAVGSLDIPVELDIIGSAADQAYLRECEALAETVSPVHRVRLLGSIPPEKARSTLSSYAALVLPTAGENFGHVIAEALSSSCPTYLPPTTPWTQIAKTLGTLVADQTEEAWAEALRQQLAMSERELQSQRDAVADAYRQWHEQQRGDSTVGLLLAESPRRLSGRPKLV